MYKELDGSGGVFQVQMLHRTNLVAIIGSGTRTKYCNNKGELGLIFNSNEFAGCNLSVEIFSIGLHRG